MDVKQRHRDAAREFFNIPPHVEPARESAAEIRFVAIGIALGEQAGREAEMRDVVAWLTGEKPDSYSDAAWDGYEAHRHANAEDIRNGAHWEEIDDGES